MLRGAQNGIKVCNCSGSHQGTKTRRIDMSFSTLSEKEEGVVRKIVDAAYTVRVFKE